MKAVVLVLAFLGLQGCVLGKKNGCNENRLIDLVFVVDASTSITIQKFDLMREFIINMIESDVKTVGHEGIKLGLVVFADHVVADIPLSKFGDPTGFKHALSQLNYTRGKTNLGKALTFVRTKSLTKENGYRPSASHVVLILTDGRLRDEQIADHEVVSLHKAGVDVLVLPMGKHPDKTKLMELVSNPDNVIETKNWKGLKEKLYTLKKKSCPVVPIVQCPSSLKANVIFLVDSSTSVGDTHFKKMNNFAMKVTKAFPVIGKDGVQVGVLQYSNKLRTKIVFKVNKYNDRKSLEGAMKDIPYTKGGATLVGYAFGVAERLLQGARKDVPNIFVALIHEKSDDDVESAASRLHKKNYVVLAVGIGQPGKQLDEAQLKAIASEPKELHVFTPKNFEDLPRFINSIAMAICNAKGFVSDQQKEERKQGIVGSSELDVRDGV